MVTKYFSSSFFCAYLTLFSFPVCPNRTWIASWDRNALLSADREPWKEQYSNTTPAQGMQRHLRSFPEQTSPGHSRAAHVYTSQWVTVLFNNNKKKRNQNILATSESLDLPTCWHQGLGPLFTQLNHSHWSNTGLKSPVSGTTQTTGFSSSPWNKTE